MAGSQQKAVVVTHFDKENLEDAVQVVEKPIPKPKQGRWLSYTFIFDTAAFCLRCGTSCIAVTGRLPAHRSVICYSSEGRGASKPLQNVLLRVTIVVKWLRAAHLHTHHDD